MTRIISLILIGFVVKSVFGLPAHPIKPYLSVGVHRAFRFTERSPFYNTSNNYEYRYRSAIVFPSVEVGGACNRHVFGLGFQSFAWKKVTNYTDDRNNPSGQYFRYETSGLSLNQLYLCYDYSLVNRLKSKYLIGSVFSMVASSEGSMKAYYDNVLRYSQPAMLIGGFTVGMRLGGFHSIYRQRLKVFYVGGINYVVADIGTGGKYTYDVYLKKYFLYANLGLSFSFGKNGKQKYIKY